MKTGLVMIFILLVAGSVCFAYDFIWDNPSGGLYSEQNNWDPNGIPGFDGGDTVGFTLPGAYTVTFDNTYQNDTLYVDGSDVTLDINDFQYMLDYSPEGSHSAVIGQSGHGSLMINHGIVYSLEVAIGKLGGSVGSLALSGSDAEWTTNFLENWHGVWIGDSGDATLAVLDNARFRHGHGLSAFAIESDAVIEVNGIDSEWYVDGQFDMSIWGNTTVDISNGGLVDIGRLTMGIYDGSSAEININSVNQHESELVLRAGWQTSLTIAQNGQAAVRLYNSKLWNQGTMILGENTGSDGLLELHDGSLADCPNSIAVGGSFKQAGGIGQIRIIDENREDEIGVRFEPTRLEGEYVKVWPQGTITMDGGTIEMEYGDSLANPIILQGGTLQGNGMIWAHVENHGGLVSPWDEEDNKVLEIGYNYTQDAMGTLKIVIAGRDPVSQYSHLRVNKDGYGQVSLNGILDVDLVDGFVPDYGDEFTIISAQNISGTFSNAVSKYVFDGGSFDVIYNTESYDSVILTHYNAEPACSHYSIADFNKDCQVNLIDFAMFAAEWLDCNLIPASYCSGM